ncbi:MAG: precorrin-6Y C5,15-methyltransferase subunit CbiT [Leptolyngbya sp. SIO4C1]|nr:precorrin-6Y C5,15-methyltransferase subunit CbiT [Leptolyngbya sp. SIO4C1]
MSAVWPYVTPGIPDQLFEQLPGIPMSQREVRLLLLGYLRLLPDAILWDIGAGTGTIAIEAGLLCPAGKVVAVERDEEVASLIQTNCDRFGVTNVEIVVGNAPECFDQLPYAPTCVLIEGGRSLKELLSEAWVRLQSEGHIVVTASNFEALYAISETFASLHVRNVEVAQPTVNRLETRGNRQILKSVDPIFILSGDKLG